MFYRSDEVLSDHAGVLHSSGDYLVTTPRTAEEVVRAIATARADGLRVRVRGNAHSVDGASIPLPGELLLRTSALDHYRFDEEGTVTVGGGATVWHANSMVGEHGFQLPVHNDPGPASSVGGYVCAGGIGAESVEHIGFWETVVEVVLVTGGGELRIVRRGDEEFRWLFGSMGQFGVIVEAKIRILPLDGAATPYPLGGTGYVRGALFDGPKALWFQAFTPAEHTAEAKMIARRIALRYRHIWKQAAPTYAIPVEFRTFTPPLVSPHQGDLVVVGTFGDIHEHGFDWATFRALGEEYTAWVATDDRMRRYASVEMLFDDFDYTAHFSLPTLREFAALKDRLDPDWLFCTGSLWEALRAQRPPR